MRAAAVLDVLLNWAWIFAVMGTCAYAVFWQGHSGWWFLLAILLTDVSNDSDRRKGERR